MLLQRPDILRPHLRALLRTAQLGEFRLVIPMLSLITELRAIKAEVNSVLKELEAETGKKLRRPPIGSMIEIPSAMMQIKDFVQESGCRRQLPERPAQLRLLSFQYFVPCSVACRARPFFVIW